MKSAASQEINRKHKEIENLFDRGLISVSLLIEAHRQLIDFTKSKNDQELNAIEALARTYALDGRLFQEPL